MNVTVVQKGDHRGPCWGGEDDRQAQHYQLHPPALQGSPMSRGALPSVWPGALELQVWKGFFPSDTDWDTSCQPKGR